MVVKMFSIKYMVDVINVYNCFALIDLFIVDYRGFPTSSKVISLWLSKTVYL